MRRQCCCSPACLGWRGARRSASWPPGFGIEVDEIKDSCTRIPAPEAFDVAAGHIPKGGQAALRFEIVGMVKGKPVIVIDHVTRLREDLCPEWPQPAQPGGSYKVEIVGAA